MALLMRTMTGFRSDAARSPAPQPLRLQRVRRRRGGSWCRQFVGVEQLLARGRRRWRCRYSASRAKSRRACCSIFSSAGFSTTSPMPGRQRARLRFGAREAVRVPRGCRFIWLKITARCARSPFSTTDGSVLRVPVADGFFASARLALIAQRQRHHQSASSQNTLPIPGIPWDRCGIPPTRIAGILPPRIAGILLLSRTKPAIRRASPASMPPGWRRPGLGDRRHPAGPCRPLCRQGWRRAPGGARPCDRRHPPASPASSAARDGGRPAALPASGSRRHPPALPALAPPGMAALPVALPAW